MQQSNKKRVVILGAGYGGVIAAQGLGKLAKKLNLDITLVNKHNYHQMVTRLHEPAGGFAEGDEVRIPLKRLVNDNVKLIKDWVEAIDPVNKQVTLKEQVVAYDYLVIGLGSDPEYFCIPGLQEHSYTLRSLNAARLIKTQIEGSLAKYKVESQSEEGLLNIVVGGAGFTGIELLGELAEWLPVVAPKYDVNVKDIRLICVEAAPTVMPGFDEELSIKAADILRNKGVELKIGTPVKEVTQDYVMIGDEKIPTKLMIWTGGVRGNSVLEDSGFTTQRGRANINEFLQSTNFEDVFIIGDSSIYYDENGRPLPPTAQIAMQQGEHLVHNIERLLTGQEMTPFVFINRGIIASIGPKEAVGIVFGKRVSGLLAVYLKRLVHYRYLFIFGGIPLVIQGFLGQFIPQVSIKSDYTTLNG
ncbi:NAD(P)/FAD-dependent oxidoreductase [Desulfuribacillus stibiiarsenatis]|uniref:NAD(P)/FAD-dependent oxidoreductase n=1 Tax=Desulfuribacillus stibiiarsenatis TaxID=1390249 RepID=UPI000AF2DAE3|nr:NAD(P)/FAD-dependent oxidoreductase [Desulfuribacillus stibiiarsenatis]